MFVGYGKIVRKRIYWEILMEIPNTVDTENTVYLTDSEINYIPEVGDRIKIFEKQDIYGNSGYYRGEQYIPAC